MWLFASYSVNLSQPLLVNAETDGNVVIAMTLKGWDAEISLMPNRRLGRIHKPQQNQWYYPVSQMEMTIACNGELGDEMLHEEGAKLMMEHLVVFLQYLQGNALEVATEKCAQYFAREGADTGLDVGAQAANGEKIEKIDYQLNYIHEYDQQLTFDYVMEQYSQSLCLAILDQAQKSMDHNRWRRACLELAMACESALELRLESSGLVKAAMGTEFAQQHPDIYEQIGQLFQIRADELRAQAFRLVDLSQQQAIKQSLTQWRDAVECLSNWLTELGNIELQEAL